MVGFVKVDQIGIKNYSSRKSIRSYVCIVLNGKILSDCNGNGMAVLKFSLKS